MDGNEEPDPLNSVPVSWAACLKMKNKAMAVEAASKRVHSWSLERAIEFYSLQRDERSSESLKKLKLFQRILLSPLGGEFHDWVDIDHLYSHDCGQLVRKLLSAQATDDALEIVHSCHVPHDLKCDVHAKHIQALGQGSASKGYGPISALRFLKTLPPNEAFDAGMKVLTSSCSLNLSKIGRAHV